MLLSDRYTTIIGFTTDFILLRMNEFFVSGIRSEKYLFVILDERKSILFVFSESNSKEDRVCQKSGTSELRLVHLAKRIGW